MAGSGSPVGKLFLKRKSSRVTARAISPLLRNITRSSAAGVGGGGGEETIPVLWGWLPPSCLGNTPWSVICLSWKGGLPPCPVCLEGCPVLSCPGGGGVPLCSQRSPPRKDMVPPSVDRHTHTMRTVPSRRTTYAGGNNATIIWSKSCRVRIGILF